MRKKIIFLLALFFFFPFFVSADYLGQKVNFFVDPSYDLEKREKISAFLKKVSPRAYFYLDEEWWQNLDYSQKEDFSLKIDSLASEFNFTIYPKLTSVFGSIPEPGIDKDERITILIHPMKEEAGGYFNPADGYSRLQSPFSNEREMLYLNALQIEKPQLKSFLAHEFFHLITFNQKDILRKVSEEVWLNEARAEYAPTFLGYDDIYQGSNLERRVRNFLERPQDSLTEWRNEGADYGVINLFTQYLVDHYGLKILIDSLNSSKVGIPSINEALIKNGFKEDFSQIFTDWTIALFLGDCNFGPKYCYKNQNLKDLRIKPLIHFLPAIGESELSINFVSRDWAGNWQKIFGGQKGTLVFEFDGSNEVFFKVPYLICDLEEKCQLQFLRLDKEQKGKITIPQFNSQYSSLTIIPSIQSKFLGFDGPERGYLFSWKVSVYKKTEKEKETELIKELLAKIEELKKQIAEYQAKIQTALTKKGGTCTFSHNLYYGMMKNPEVNCLQEFLKSQGREIYPQGIISGNFLTLTKLAVIRFQEKYREEILSPLGLKKGTGFVGQMTRNKINQILGR